MAPGLLVLSLFSVTLYAMTSFSDRKIHVSVVYLKQCFTVVFFISFLYIVTISINNYEFMHIRFLSSYVFLIWIMLSSILLSGIISRCKDVGFNNAMSFTFWILLLIGVFSTYLILNNVVSRKSMILFTEPSHYAMYFAPFLLYKSYVDFNKRKVNVLLYISTVFFMAVMVKNTTLLMVVLITLGVLYAGNIKVLLSIIIALTLFVVNSDYFLTRMTLSFEANNVSVLVFLSGWERAYLALVDSYGFGLGFQQMGIGPMGVNMELLAKFGAEGLNYNDGGSLAPKIISEFGIFGIALLVMYIRKLAQVFRNMVKRKGELDLKSSFFYSVYLMTFVMVFIRGAGYFTPMLIIFFASVVWFSSLNRHSH